jgi:hypothetical protein
LRVQRYLAPSVHGFVTSIVVVGAVCCLRGWTDVAAVAASFAGSWTRGGEPWSVPTKGNGTERRGSFVAATVTGRGRSRPFCEKWRVRCNDSYVIRLASGDLLGRFFFHGSVLRLLASLLEDSGFVGVSSMFCENFRVTCVIVSSSCPTSAVGDRPGGGRRIGPATSTSSLLTHEHAAARRTVRRHVVPESPATRKL